MVAPNNSRSWRCHIVEHVPCSHVWKSTDYFVILSIFEPRSWSTRCLSTVAASTLLPRVGTDGQTRWAVAQKMMTTYSGYCCRFAPIECIESYWIQLNHIFACASLCIRVFLHHYQATVFVWFIPDLHHCCLLWCSVLQPPGTSWHLGPVRSKTYCKYINSLYSLFIALIE